MYVYEKNKKKKFGKIREYFVNKICAKHFTDNRTRDHCRAII